MAAAIGLKNLKAEHKRAEEVKEKFDFIVGRAVTKKPAFYGWVQHKISNKSSNDLPNGLLLLKGGDLEEELIDFESEVVCFDLKEFFKEPFFETKKVVYLPM